MMVLPTISRLAWWVLSFPKKKRRKVFHFEEEIYYMTT